jgi:hypothetical protein
LKIILGFGPLPSYVCACLTFKPFLAGEINAAKQSELNILIDEVDSVQSWLLSLEKRKGFLRFSFYISYGML